MQFVIQVDGVKITLRLNGRQILVTIFKPFSLIKITDFLNSNFTEFRP